MRTALEDRARRELPHLANDEVRVLTEIVERLVDAYEPDRVYLFGSKARGDFSPDSDFDLLVVVPDTAPDERKRSRLAYERLWDVGTAGDVVVTRPVSGWRRRQSISEPQSTNSRQSRDSRRISCFTHSRWPRSL